MKRRIVSALWVLPFLLILCVILACNLHHNLSGNTGFLWKPEQLWELLKLGKVQLFFTAFSLLSVILILACLTGGPGVYYHNSTVHIAPRIRIPAPAGNGEYGTSWFMNERELSETFSVCRIPKLDIEEGGENYGKKE